MYQPIHLLIAVILFTSISVTARWSRSNMPSFLFSSMDLDNQQKTVLRPEGFRRLLVANPSLLPRSDLPHRSQTNQEFHMECCETKPSSRHPLLGNDCLVIGSFTFRQLFHVMEQYIASVPGITKKQTDWLHAAEHATIKVVLLVLVQTLLGGNSGMDMRFLLTAALILYFNVLNVLALPMASFSPTLHASWVTSSIVTISKGKRLNVTATKSLHTSGAPSVTQLKNYGSPVYFYRSTVTYSSGHSVRSTATSTFDLSSTQRPVSRSDMRKLLSERLDTHSNSGKGSLLKQGACEMGWLEFGENHHCYRFIKEDNSFNHAQKVCFYEGAHLVTTSTKNENDYIFNMTKTFTSDPDKRAIWIGLERLSSDSRLHWVDGRPLDYQRWAPGEPDSNGACVKMIHKAWWEDTACVQQLYFVCERDGVPSPPYSRSVELGILIGIPMACTLVMLSVVVVLFAKSVRDSAGTHFGYGKKREKGILHSCLVKHITVNGHIGPQDPNSELDLRPRPTSTSRRLTPPEITITPGTPELPEPQEARIFASTSSIEQEPSRFQSTTSLDHLVSKSYFKSKGRHMRSLRKSEAVVSPAGKEGRFRKRDQCS